jgi:hypothetical protein
MDVNKFMPHQDQSIFATHTYYTFHYLQHDKIVTYIRTYKLCLLLPRLLINTITRIGQLV